MTGTIDVTVAAIIEEDKRFLLVEELVGGDVVLNQPAGHVEPEEAVITAVIRETFEETGYRFAPQALVGIYTWTSPADGRSFLRLCFTGTATAPAGHTKLDDGIIAARWFSRSELDARRADLRSPLVLRAIEDYDAGCRHPLDCLRHVPAPANETEIRALG